VANTLVIAMLLHRRNLVRIDELPWAELGKAAVTALAAGLLSYRVGRRVMLQGSRMADVRSIALVSITWAGAIAAGFWLTRSQLLSSLLRRKGTIYPRVAERQAEELSKGIEP